MRSAIELSRVPAAVHPVAAMSGDGTLAVVTDGDAVRIAGGSVLCGAAGVVGAGAVDGGTWIVTDDGEHQLHRFDRSGAPLGSVALGRLGDGVAMATLRTGLRAALIEGQHAVMVTERDGELAVEPLGARGADRRVLVGGRGVIERRAAQLAWLR